jgi:serine/threonine protein kinase
LLFGPLLPLLNPTNTTTNTHTEFKDNSAELLNQDPVEIWVPPNHDLEKFISTALTSADNGLIGTVFKIVADKEGYPTRFLHNITEACLADLSKLEGECAYIHFLDCLLQTSFKILNYAVCRNTGNAHKTSLNHPDVLVLPMAWYAQEKLRKSYLLNDPKKDPVKQLQDGFDYAKWEVLHSDVPMVPAYIFISPNELCLGFVHKRDKLFHADLNLDLSNVSHRLKAVAWQLSKFPEISKIGKKWTDAPRFLLRSRTTHADVYVSSDKVLKIMKGDNRAMVNYIYSSLPKNSNGPILIPYNSTVSSCGDILLEFPRCEEIADSVFENKAVRLNFASTIACALTELHSFGIVHHDVTLSNVLQRENGKFVLNDLGEALKLPNQSALLPGISHLNQSYHPTRIQEDHSVEVDIWSFSVMLGSLGLFLDTNEISEMLRSIYERFFADDAPKNIVQQELLTAMSSSLKFVIKYCEIVSYDSDNGKTKHEDKNDSKTEYQSIAYREAGVYADLLCIECHSYSSESNLWKQCQTCFHWLHNSCDSENSNNNKDDNNQPGMSKQQGKAERNKRKKAENVQCSICVVSELAVVTLSGMLCFLVFLFHCPCLLLCCFVAVLLLLLVRCSFFLLLLLLLWWL